MGSLSHRHTRRRGSLIVEAAICFVLLATAVVALMKLAQGSSRLSKQADQRLVATLAAENTLERLQHVGTDALKSRAEEIAAAIAEQTRCDVQVTVEDFQSQLRSGTHLRVEASCSPEVRITLHDWRLDDDN
ncbi:hypothetical protein [Novipirellula caenicola]|uniref:Uncharacterized protein n=1 Tax=Novipirellula caenicola TaxID=1536901 RepID=A0ABP9VQM2_9BACT